MRPLPCSTFSLDIFCSRFLLTVWPLQSFCSYSVRKLYLLEQLEEWSLLWMQKLLFVIADSGILNFLARISKGGRWTFLGCLTTQCTAAEPESSTPGAPVLWCTAARDTQMQLITSSEHRVNPQLDKGTKTLGHLCNRWMWAWTTQS